MSYVDLLILDHELDNDIYHSKKFGRYFKAQKHTYTLYQIIISIKNV